jgi:Coenzyme PQQ synthesis protein D (PqqD)
MRQSTVLAAPTSGAGERAAITASTVVRLPPYVVFRTFSTEALLLNLETGLYHSLNSTGGRMLELLAECGLVHTVVERLAAEYDRSEERLLHELCGYCAELAAHGLLELDPSA